MKKAILFSLSICLCFAFSLPVMAIDRVTGVKVKQIKFYTAKVKWSAVNDAASYIIKIRKKKNKKLVDTIKTTSTSTWVNLPKKKKYYRAKVRAKDSNGVLGQWSKAKLFKSKSWRYYHHNNFGFSLKFPKSWKGVKGVKYKGTLIS